MAIIKKYKDKSETTAAVPTIHQGDIIPMDKLFSIVGEIEKLLTEEAALEKGQWRCQDPVHGSNLNCANGAKVMRRFR